MGGGEGRVTADHSGRGGNRKHAGIRRRAGKRTEAPRYLRLRADTLMGMFRYLPAPARARALAALARSTAEAGGDSARRYAAAGAKDAAALLAKVEKTAAELGWGEWRFGKRTAARLALEVRDSPFAAGYGAADTEVCAPIAGMLQAVAGMVLGAPCEARETGCCARGAKRCRFVAILGKQP
jgi:predicted hydrocarbon binding protein